MSGSNSAERKRHEPLVLVETADLSEEDWLDYRRRGIGGSDVSAIFGTSPFRTANCTRISTANRQKLLYPPAFTDKVILKPKCPQNIRKFGQFKK